MSAKFYTLLTDIGAAKLASAAALGVPLKITHMAVGDGGGVLPTPSAQQTALVAEKRRASLNMLYIDPQNSSHIIAEQVIPETEGGWWIREVGLFDETGALIAVGNCPESYKPQLAEGSGRTQTVRMVLITSSTDNITLKIDPAVVLATRKYVDDKALELKVYVDDLMAKHLAAVDPHSQYAPKDSPTLTGTPKAPTAAAGNNSVQIANTAFVQAAILALIGGAPATLDTLKEIAAAINNDPNFSTTINNALALKAPLASPVLTGTPKAPTAAAGNNSVQIANTAFVQDAILALIGGAPATLGTLKEIAAAINNDPNFSTTINNALALKAPLASPVLTGTPTAPTAAQTVNNTQIATTEFVKSAVAGLVGSSPKALDTLNELAAALGNDPKFATTMTNALAGKQPLDDTLTSLSGKSISELLQYLGLENATKAIIHTGKVIADLNDPPKNSTGFAYRDAQNSPGFNATVLTVDSIEGSYDIQIAIGYNPLKFAFRAYSGDAKVWLNWMVLGNAAAKNTGTTAGTVAAGDDSRITGAIQRNAMVGAVSQKGGAPTGAIIERGSNSNGEYTKFADGTLICWFTRSAESTANNSSGGTTNLYFSSEVELTFPATFVGTTPTVTPSASLSSGGTSSWPSVRGRSLTGTSLALISNAQNAAAYLGYTAIGRWF
ncbi:phage tail protein [Citrobacter freundii]|uniref:phage tail protein n=1 Tax=Citrobacter freundii TaxID=546 RepID=UPI001F5B93D8|nr:phage tail protein [Citrobacter freundii]